MQSQLPGLRIAPLRQPASRRSWDTHAAFEPAILASASSTTTKKSMNWSVEGSTSTAKSTARAAEIGPDLPKRLPTLKEFVNAARTSDASLEDKSFRSTIPPPPKTILPAFINLQTVEKLPYIFEDGNASQRRRFDVPSDQLTSDHLQLPVPQTRDEKRRRPFGPFAILNGLNEPPPNAALFPPIESGSFPSILSRPSTQKALEVSEKHPERQTDKRELRLEEILDPNSLNKSHINEVETPVREESTRIATPEKCAREQSSKKNTPENSSPALDDDGNKAITPKSIATDEPMSPKSRGRSRKNLRRWTEQETTDLLKGVIKCGIGNWTAILQQPDLKFNKRSASNLKDRFRVCCPWAYGASDPNAATKQIQDTLANALINAKSPSSGAGGKILLPDPRPKENGIVNQPDLAESSTSALSESSSSSVPHKQTSPESASAPNSDLSTKGVLSSQSKYKSTLSSLGISEPYFTIKSKRRSRRPFTAAEDEALLKGYAVHGFQWTAIQQDKHLNLSHRRATDLRDRFRTKFPNAYREGGSVSGGSMGSIIRETSNENSSGLENHKRRKTTPSQDDDAQKLARSMPPSNTSCVTPADSKTTTTSSSQSTEQAGLTSRSSLLPPLPPLTQSTTQIDSVSNTVSAAGGSTVSSGAVFLSSGMAQGHQTSNSVSHCSGTATTNSWEDNTLPPFNWSDDIG